MVHQRRWRRLAIGHAGVDKLPDYLRSEKKETNKHHTILFPHLHIYVSKMTIWIAFMHDYMQLTDFVDLGRHPFIEHPTHCTLHMFKIKTWIYEPVYYLNTLVLNAK